MTMYKEKESVFIDQHWKVSEKEKSDPPPSLTELVQKESIEEEEYFDGAPEDAMFEEQHEDLFHSNFQWGEVDVIDDNDYDDQLFCDSCGETGNIGGMEKCNDSKNEKINEKNNERTNASVIEKVTEKTNIKIPTKRTLENNKKVEEKMNDYYSKNFGEGKISSEKVSMKKKELKSFGGSKTKRISKEGQIPKGQEEVGNKGGCQCRRSMCLKKYCDCYNLGKKCGKFCKCQNCSN